MEWDKVKFESFRPSYEKYFDTYLKDKSITEYVSFSKWDSSLIFYKDDFVGFYKTITPDEEKNDKETNARRFSLGRCYCCKPI